ncbi:hypothetical protein [Flavobacterium sp.]|uniref:hypothetical protein n=1 Tax=Flavobacterium sp. TaxID=239 RepID=UPI00262E8CE9|nr:hypothetical protein [Flavobacterium sp.]MDD2986129.1 hypothetical protein [Flavobacterium sp.]
MDCTISIDSSGTLVIRAINANGASITQSESNYVIDTIPPSVPNLMVDIQTPYSINSPLVEFNSTDNIAIDYCLLNYFEDDNVVGTTSGALTSINPAVSPLIVALDPDQILHTITVRCFDTAGNFAQNSITFPPIVAFNAPTQISNTPITDATVTITSPNGNDIDSIVLTSNSSGAFLGACNPITGVFGQYLSPVTCSLEGITQSMTIQIDARDVLTNAVGQNSMSFIIDTVSPSISITAPTLVSHTGISNTTIRVTDDVLIYATGVQLS